MSLKWFIIYWRGFRGIKFNPRPGLSLGPLLLLGLAASSLLLLGGLGGGLGILLGILLSSHDGTKLDLQYNKMSMISNTEERASLQKQLRPLWT